MNDIELQQLEQSIDYARSVVVLGEALERILSNRDFKQVISQGYFEQEAIRLVHLKAAPNMQSTESQKAILLQMDAIGSLSGYLQTVRARASMAAKSIQDDEQARDDLLAEGI